MVYTKKFSNFAVVKIKKKMEININEQKRYFFKKDYVTSMGTLPENSQIDIVHGIFYFNGGMCDPTSAKMFENMIDNPKLKQEYLREAVIPYNKV